MQSTLPIIFLMGPTASGKTDLAVTLVQQLPCEIISVDSAMVYKGMDIGTSKPTAEILKIAPHRLIDLVDPKESYSAGQFVKDAQREIDDIHHMNKIPLLVGGTMLYFRCLLQGLSLLPAANAAIRERLRILGEAEGWPALHAELARVDKEAALRINPQDSQRIQRALEVYELSGKPISAWQKENVSAVASQNIIQLGLMPSDREKLHARIAARFQQMLHLGLIEEVERLYSRGDLSVDLPAIRSVGYRQVWEYLSGRISYTEMQEKAIAATRQLAKRQMTWLRSWENLTLFASEERILYQQIQNYLKQ